MTMRLRGTEVQDDPTGLRSCGESPIRRYLGAYQRSILAMRMDVS